MRVGFYGRVSTEEQAKEGYSIAAQKERGTQFAQSQDWTVVDYYIDEGFSAKDTNRPELQRLIKDVEAGQIDVVLVFRLDRLTRSVLDLYKLLDHFEKHKTGFRSSTEVYDTTTAIGRLFLTLVAALAQWERENLGERVKVGMEQMTREGKFHGGHAPYGYRIGEHGKLVVEEEESQIVRLIFDKYLTGIGVIKLAKWLNQSGITKGGSRWHDATVSYILKNPIYIGSLRWNKRSDGEYFEVPDVMPAIIEQNIFDRAQEQLAQRAGQHPRSVASDYIFSGHLICGRCGSTLAAASKKERGKRYKDYKCRGQIAGTCDLPRFSEMKMEKTFLEYITFIRNSELVNEIAAGEEQDDNTEIQLEMSQIEKELQKLKERRKKWQLLFADDLITLEELRERTTEDGNREKELTKRLAELKEHTSAPSHSKEELALALLQFDHIWHAMDDYAKKAAVNSLVDKIVVDAHAPKKFSRNKTIQIKEMSFT